jgi:hypothetical protein
MRVFTLSLIALLLLVSIAVGEEEGDGLMSFDLKPRKTENTGSLFKGVPTPPKSVSYVVEHDLPIESKVLAVGDSYRFKVWPKNEKGENITVEYSSFVVLPIPDELPVTRINSDKREYIELEFTPDLPHNPCGMYLISKEGLILHELLFACAEGNVKTF